MKDSLKKDHYLKFSIEMLENIAKSACLEAHLEGQTAMRLAWWDLAEAALYLIKLKK